MKINMLKIVFAALLAVTACSKPDNGKPDPTPVDPTDDIQTLTVAQFLNQQDNDNVWYRLKGTILSISSYEYGDFYLMDDTGILYIYGMAPKKDGSNQDFKTLNLKPTDIVTLVAHRYTHYEVPEAKGGYYEKHESGRPYLGYTSDTATAKWLELPETKANDGNQFIHHKGELGERNYSAYLSVSDRVSLWTCYPYVKGQGGTGRPDDPYAFDPLADVSDQASLSKTYKVNTFSDLPNDKFVRGHMVPSNDRSGRANYDVFLSTNIMPQSDKLNGGVWNEVEIKIHNTWSSKCDTLYIVNGTVLKDSKHKVVDIDGKEITVPTAVYKAILAKTKTGEYKGLGMYFKNRAEGSSASAKSLAMSIDDLEKLVGIDFFVNLPADTQKTVEAQNPQDDNWWWN